MDSLTGDLDDCWRTALDRRAHADPTLARRVLLRLPTTRSLVKVGPTASADDLISLAERSTRLLVPGRLTLIARMGSAGRGAAAPPAARDARGAHHFVWTCDRGHENVFKTADGFKNPPLRRRDGEIEGFFASGWGERIWPGGVHLEYTGADVTEWASASAMKVLRVAAFARYELCCARA